MPDIYQKSGYLNSPFRLFYLEDLPGREYTYHYHDFHKLLIFLNGTVSYRVEGREYDLKPGDQVLIPAGEIHCPVVHPSATYTRLIAYISPDYFSTLSGECDLSGCFSHALEAHENLIRIPDYFSGSLYPVLQELIFGRFWYFFLSEVKIRRISSAVKPLSVEAGKSENLSDSSHRQSTDLTDS